MSKAKKAGSAHWGSLRHPSIFWVGHKDDDDAVTEMKATGGNWNFFFGLYNISPPSPQLIILCLVSFWEIERRSLANCIGKKNGLCSHRQLNIGHSYGFGSHKQSPEHTHMHVILLPDLGFFLYYYKRPQTSYDLSQHGVCLCLPRDHCCWATTTHN